MLESEDECAFDSEFEDYKIEDETEDGGGVCNTTIR